jgi:hypothetical protein
MERGVNEIEIGDKKPPLASRCGPSPSQPCPSAVRSSAAMERGEGVRS